METGNGADKLITTILEEAREQAAAIEWHSNENIAAINAKLERGREALREEFTLRAKNERELILKTAVTNARLENGKELLKGKRAVIDRAYEEAAKAVCALEGEKRASLLLSMLRRECEGGETVHASEKDRAALEKAIAACPELRLKLGGDAEVSDGFTLEGSNYYKDCSFAALMEQARAATESEVCGILFDR